MEENRGKRDCSTNIGCTMPILRRVELLLVLLTILLSVQGCCAAYAPRIMSLRGGAGEGRADGGSGKGAQIVGMEGRAARLAAKTSAKSINAVEAAGVATRGDAGTGVVPLSPGAAAAAARAARAAKLAAEGGTEKRVTSLPGESANDSGGRDGAIRGTAGPSSLARKASMSQGQKGAKPTDRAPAGSVKQASKTIEASLKGLSIDGDSTSSDEPPSSPAALAARRAAHAATAAGKAAGAAGMAAASTIRAGSSRAPPTGPSNTDDSETSSGEEANLKAAATDQDQTTPVKQKQVPTKVSAVSTPPSLTALRAMAKRAGGGAAPPKAETKGSRAQQRTTDESDRPTTVSRSSREETGDHQEAMEVGETGIIAGWGGASFEDDDDDSGGQTELLDRLARAVSMTEERIQQLQDRRKGEDAEGDAREGREALELLMQSQADLDQIEQQLELLRVSSTVSPMLGAGVDVEQPSDGLYYVEEGGAGEARLVGALEIRAPADCSLRRATQLVGDGGVVLVSPGVSGWEGVHALGGLASEGDSSGRTSRRLEVRASGAGAPEVLGRWLLGRETSGLLVGCKLRHSTTTDFFLSTLDVWGGPWVVDDCHVESMNGTAVLGMNGGELSLSRSCVGGASELAGECAADGIVIVSGSTVNSSPSMTLEPHTFTRTLCPAAFLAPCPGTQLLPVRGLSRGGGILGTGVAGKDRGSFCAGRHGERRLHRGGRGRGGARQRAADGAQLLPAPPAARTFAGRRGRGYSERLHLCGPGRWRLPGCKGAQRLVAPARQCGARRAVGG